MTAEELDHIEIVYNPDKTCCLCHSKETSFRLLKRLVDPYDSFIARLCRECTVRHFISAVFIARDLDVQDIFYLKVCGRFVE